MIGTCKPKIIVDQKKTLMESSIKFAEFDNPDFIIMKEAILAFEKLFGDKENTEEQKGYIFNMISIINSKFGT